MNDDLYLIQVALSSIKYPTVELNTSRLIKYLDVKRAVDRELKYPTPKMLELANQISLHAKRKLTKKDTKSVIRINLLWARLNVLLRNAKTLERLIKRIPSQGKVTYEMNNFHLSIQRDPFGVFISGMVGGERGDMSTTIVTALGNAFLKDGTLPPNRRQLNEMCRAILIHGNRFDHAIIED